MVSCAQVIDARGQRVIENACGVDAAGAGGTQSSWQALKQELLGATSRISIQIRDYASRVCQFYPQDFTPGCTLEVRRFQRDLPQYRDRNAQILGISADDTASHDDFCDSEGLKFPLLADTDGRVSKAYGSWLGARSLRHSFIIDPQGIVRSHFVGVNPAVHSQEVLDRLDELQRA